MEWVVGVIDVMIQLLEKINDVNVILVDEDGDVFKVFVLFFSVVVFGNVVCVL